jgi:hypothetical protein
MPRMATTTPFGPNGSACSALAMNSSPPSWRSVTAKSVAPRKMPKMKAVVTVVFWHTSLRTAHVSRRLAIARSVAPKAPSPEASVGVAMPKKIEPSTARISAKGGSTASSVFRTRRMVTGSRSVGAGASFGRSCAETTT